MIPPDSDGKTFRFAFSLLFVEHPVGVPIPVNDHMRLRQSNEHSIRTVRIYTGS